MPSDPRSRPATFAWVLAGALLTAALPAAGQDPASTPLATVVGDSLAYRVDLPERARIYREPITLKAYDGKVSVSVDAWPLAELRDISTLDAILSDPDALASDPVLLALWEHTRCPIHGPGVKVRERRTLGGAPAAYLRGQYAEDIYHGWYEAYVALHDGVVYMLTLHVEGDGYAAHEPLLVRIRDSFRFPPPR